MFYTLRKKILFGILMVSMAMVTLRAAESNQNLTDTQLHAVMGVITSFILSNVYTGCDDNDTITHNGTDYCAVVSPYTGKVWLDRNLGAAQVCKSLDDSACYGDYYQWGRDYDGHQDSTSSTTSTQATDVNSAGSSFITSSSTYNYDWAEMADSDGSQRSANWSKTDGSSVCPVGFRVPSIDELRAELLDTGSAQIDNSADAFNSFLALPSVGYRYYNYSAPINYVGSWGRVWSSSVDGSHSHYVLFSGVSAYSNYSYIRANGFSVRCLRD